jgi:predicted nucleic acid-binding protein
LPSKLEKHSSDLQRPLDEDISPSLFDAIVLATARVYDSKVVTGDELFEGLSETLLI